MPNVCAIASGTIEPCRFVKIDQSTSPGFHVLQVTANTDVVCGISQEGSLDPPGVNGSQPDAARATYPLQVYTIGDICLLEIASTVTQGQWLVPDSNGRGVPWSASASNLTVGAMALQGATVSSNNPRIRVQVVEFSAPNVAAS